MKTNFAKSLELVLVHEGGWSNDSRDPGGATMRGVTQRVYDGYRLTKGKPKGSVRDITEIELMDIYRNQYWSVIKGDDLPAGIDYATFDGAVNSGPLRSAEWLQSTIGVAVDGHIGAITLAAAKAANAESVIRRMFDKRMAFLKGLPTWATFGNGWTSRVDGVRRDAIAMALASPPQPVPAPEAPELLPAQETPPQGFYAALLAFLRQWGVKV